MIGKAITRARSLGLACLVISFFIISCGTTALPPAPGIVPLPSIASVDDAQRGLISMQEFRFGILRTVQAEISNGKRPLSDKADFEAIDAPFRTSWSNAHHYLDEWVKTKTRPKEFDTYYQVTYDHALRLLFFQTRPVLKPENH